MISLDTNVLLAALGPGDAWHLLDRVGSEAPAIGPVVYSELA